MNTLILLRPLNETFGRVCPKCKPAWQKLPTGCPDVPPCQLGCPRCRRGRLAVPPGCPLVPLCRAPWMRHGKKESEEQNDQLPGRICLGCDGHGILALDPHHHPGILQPCPPGIEPSARFPCRPRSVHKSKDGWKRAFDTHVEENQVSGGWPYPPGLLPTCLPWNKHLYPHCHQELLKNPKDGWKGASLEA